jgi:hypothetical protein
MLLADRGLHKGSLRDPADACLLGSKGGVLVRTLDLRRRLRLPAPP